MDSQAGYLEQQALSHDGGLPTKVLGVLWRKGPLPILERIPLWGSRWSLPSDTLLSLEPICTCSMDVN